MKAEERLASKEVFDGRILRLRVDRVRLPDGGEAVREVVEHRPAVVIVPIDAEGRVVMVRQYRYAVREALLEAPAGIVEAHEKPEECAQRELQEEVGYKAGSLRRLGEFWTTPGFSDELMYAYVATDLVPSVLDPDADENIEIERVPLSRIAEMVRSGEIRDAKTIAACLMVAGHAGQP